MLERIYCRIQVNTFPSLIQEEGILWAGITCRSAKTLLRRQDSYQSLCSIHASTTNIVMENYQDILEVKNVVLYPGDNIVEVPVKVRNFKMLSRSDQYQWGDPRTHSCWLSNPWNQRWWLSLQTIQIALLLVLWKIYTPVYAESAFQT